MRYEYVLRPYDRTPEGNIPTKETFEAKNDLQAIAHVMFYGDFDGLSDKELVETLVEEELLDESFLPYKPVKTQRIIKAIENYKNESLDPSDAFVFYIKNLYTGKMVYENDYMSVKEWIEDLVMDDVIPIEDVKQIWDNGFHYPFILNYIDQWKTYNMHEGRHVRYGNGYRKYAEKIKNKTQLQKDLRKLMLK